MNYDEYIVKHFPQIDDGIKLCGNKILCQLRTVPKASAGGIVLVNDTKDFNQHNTRVAILRKLGPIAFRSRETGSEWREGAWAVVGDVVIIPSFGGFRFALPIPGTDDEAIFCIIDDYTLQLVVEANFEAFDKLL